MNNEHNEEFKAIKEMTRKFDKKMLQVRENLEKGPLLLHYLERARDLVAEIQEILGDNKGMDDEMIEEETFSLFRVYGNNKIAFGKMDSAKLGKALKAAFRYCDGIKDIKMDGSEDKLTADMEAVARDIEADISDEVVKMAFRLFQQGVSDSKLEYERAVKDCEA